MDNFIIGTFCENINLLFHNLHVIQDTIPKKLSHLTDLSWRWTVNKTGDIIPLEENTLSIGSSDKPLKSCFLSENSLYIIKKKNNDEFVSIKFGVSENNCLEITWEVLSENELYGVQQYNNKWINKINK